MRKFDPDDDLRRRWKLPGRISGLSLSACCDAGTVLAKVMDNGLIGRYCETCGNHKSFLPKAQFVKMNWSFYTCPECHGKMRPDLMNYNDFSLVCDNCQVFITIAELVPHHYRTQWSSVRMPLLMLMTNLKLRPH